MQNLGSEKAKCGRVGSMGGEKGKTGVSFEFWGEWGIGIVKEWARAQGQGFGQVGASIHKQEGLGTDQHQGEDFLAGFLTQEQATTA